jgi:hypothetical protein
MPSNTAQKRKYDPLAEWLKRLDSGIRKKQIAFEDIAKMIKDKLPPTAYKNPNWWSNDSRSPGRQSYAWLSAGFKVCDLNLGQHLVTFARL